MPPRELLYVCSGQGEQALCPVTADMLPMGHCRQDATESATGELEYVPTPHCTQAEEPGSAQDPSGQHTVVAGALRVPPPPQGVQVVALKAALKVSAPQGSQVMAPVTGLRAQAVPRGQGTQPGAAPPKKPGAQHEAHPGAENSPAAHGVQEVE